MRAALWVALVMAAGASLYLSRQEDETAVLVERPDASPRRHAAPQVAAGIVATTKDAGRQDELVKAVDAWTRRMAALNQPVPVGDMPGTAWAAQQPPPPPSPRLDPAASAPPMAPPFPHAWIGRYVDTVPRAVISGPSRTWVVQAGDVIDGLWRIDAVTERQLRMSYLPLQQSQMVVMK